MKKILCLVLIVTAAPCLFAQTANTDTTGIPKVTVTKDPRLDILAKVQFDNNTVSKRFAKGYRLFVLKTNNRDYAMQVRSYLLQNFPDEKVIMSYQSPFIKMKFGDFEDKKEAEKCRDQILKGGVVTGNVYIVPDTIELKPDKEGKEDSK
jgi:hypothetical protein